jgi:FO synthase subunit 1
MEQLRDCNVSMGLMLEQLTPALMSRGGVHQFAPSKNPSERLAQLQQAGRLRIPFTTGLLLGIGETEGDRMATLEAIASVAQQFHNIQEVIIQPYRSGDVDQWAQRLKGAEESLAFALCDLPRIVRRAREILPHDVVIQVPPNLVESPDILLECLAAGATDLGGMSPRDEVNPSFGFPPLEKLRNLLDSEGYNLCERLAVHERFISWLPPRLQQLITDGS